MGKMWFDERDELELYLRMNMGRENATKEEQACFDLGLSTGKFVGYWKGIKHSIAAVSLFMLLHLILKVIEMYATN